MAKRKQTKRPAPISDTALTMTLDEFFGTVLHPSMIALAWRIREELRGQA